MSLLGPDGNPIEVVKPDPEQAVFDHVQALVMAFCKKITDAGEVGVSMASVLDALVQTYARVQVSRGCDPKTSMEQFVNRFVPSYQNWFRQMQEAYERHQRQGG